MQEINELQKDTIEAINGKNEAIREVALPRVIDQRISAFRNLKYHTESTGYLESL
jgi:hypothetical protein